MSTERRENIKDYYSLMTDVDIGLVAGELLGPHVLHESDHLLQCTRPNQRTRSQWFLPVMLDRQGWYCGGATQLVEFTQSGKLTRSQSRSLPESHHRLSDSAGESS